MASVAYNRLQTARAAKRRDDFADIVAEGGTVAEAARRMGMSYGAGKKLWRCVKDGLGSQAC